MWGIIPQLFYDFIARIVPGFTLTLLTLIVIPGYSNIVRAERLNEVTYLSVCLGILVAYLVGLIMGQISEMTLKKLLKVRYKKIENERKVKCLNEFNKVRRLLGKPSITSRASNLPEVSIMHDHMRYFEPADAARLLKLRAERRLCEVFITGFAIIWLVYIEVLFINISFLFISISFLYNGSFVKGIILFLSLPLLSIIFWKLALRLHEHLTDGATTGWLFKMFL